MIEVVYALGCGVILFAVLVAFDRIMEKIDFWKKQRYYFLSGGVVEVETFPLF